MRADITELFLHFERSIDELIFKFDITILLESPESRVTARQTSVAQNPNFQTFCIMFILSHKCMSWSSFRRRIRILPQIWHKSNEYARKCDFALQNDLLNPHLDRVCVYIWCAQPWLYEEMNDVLKVQKQSDDAHYTTNSDVIRLYGSFV